MTENYLDEALDAWNGTFDLPPLSDFVVRFSIVGGQWEARYTPGPILGGELVGRGWSTVEALISLRAVIIGQIRTYEREKRS